MNDLAKTPPVVRTDTQPGYAPIAGRGSERHPGSPESADPRSPGELKQLLGVANIDDIVVWEVPAEEAAMDVHADTRDQLRWKPQFVAEPRVRRTDEPFDAHSSGPKVQLTRAEADALRAAGAHARRAPG